MFSFLIVTRNRHRRLVSLLRQIVTEMRNENYQYEILVYDDCSDDITLYNEDDIIKLIKYFQGYERVGLIEARNKLLLKVSQESKFVVFIDDDMFFYNLVKILNTAVQFFNKGYVGVSIPFINLPLSVDSKVSRFKSIRSMNFDSDAHVYFFGGASIFKKNVFDEVGLLEGNYFIYLEEEDFSLRLFAKGYKVITMFGFNFVGLHDQEGGKDWKERNVFLFSNRLLYHHKFIKSVLIKYLFNFIYLLLYLIKIRSLHRYKKAIMRYFQLKKRIIRILFPTKVIIRFLIKRYLFT